jgi:hypothetical protein
LSKYGYKIKKVYILAISLKVAQNQLNQWLDCSTAIATNQSYKINDRAFTRADLAEVNKSILLWEKKVNQLTLSGGKVRRGPVIRRGVVLD